MHHQVEASCLALGEVERPVLTGVRHERRVLIPGRPDREVGKRRPRDRLGAAHEDVVEGEAGDQVFCRLVVPFRLK